MQKPVTASLNGVSARTTHILRSSTVDDEEKLRIEYRIFGVLIDGIPTRNWKLVIGLGINTQDQFANLEFMGNDGEWIDFYYSSTLNDWGVDGSDWAAPNIDSLVKSMKRSAAKATKFM